MAGGHRLVMRATWNLLCFWWKPRGNTALAAAE
jgi:hypothetical protein